MRSILRKEMKLSSLLITYLFIAFGLMFLIPGYPVLCGEFFITMGIFQSFRYAVESGDIVFSALLPIAKHDVVKGKFIFTCFIELCGFAVMACATLVRMTALVDSTVYRQNALMNANCFALGMALLMFGVFNLMFICGFFKTAYKTGRPFVIYIFVCFAIIGVAEALHHVPGLEALNAFGFEHAGLQATTLVLGAAVFAGLTALAYRISCNRFEMIDL